MIIGLLAPREEKVRASTRRHSPSSKNRRKMRRRRRRRGRRFRFQLFHRPSRAARDRPNLFIYIYGKKVWKTQIRVLWAKSFFFLCIHTRTFTTVLFGETRYFWGLPAIYKCFYFIISTNRRFVKCNL